MGPSLSRGLPCHMCPLLRPFLLDLKNKTKYTKSLHQSQDGFRLRGWEGKAGWDRRLFSLQAGEYGLDLLFLQART